MGKLLLIEQDPDGDLLALIARGDQWAIKTMVNRKLPRLLALGVRMLNDRGAAEDIAQETFVRIWKHAAQWQPGIAKFDTWIHRVALNLCYDKLRGRLEWTDDEVPESADPSLFTEDKLVAAEERDLVTRALAALPYRQREALVLQYYQELSNKEAALAMNISVDALESLLSRARHNMRAWLLKTNDTGRKT